MTRKWRSTVCQVVTIFISSIIHISDPLGEVHKLYDFNKMILSQEAKNGMIEYINNDTKKHKYGKHMYSMEEFGLTEEYITTEFKDLTDRLAKLVWK